MMKKINTTYLIALSALVFASCSESDGLSNGIALSKEKIAFAATLQDGWNGGTSAEAGNDSRAGKPSFSGLAMEQKVLTANEGLAKPLYLHPLETENTSVMNAMPQTRGAMNESSTVGSFGVSAVYSKDGSNSSLFQNEEATQNGNYWFTSNKETWPLDGSVSFYAYAPYNETSLSFDDVVKNKTIRYTANTDFSKQPDLIVAKSENNAFTSSTANNAVGLSFSHALTAITFSISADMIPGTVKSITVSGVYGQGDYDFSNASWPSTSLANPSTYVITLNASVKAGESKALTDKTSALMMIPQKLGADAKVSMVFYDDAKDKTVSFSLNGTSWTAGKHITYVLSSSKITTLNMGSLTYPTGWNSVNTGAKNQIRTAYASNTSAGLFVVNEEKNVIAANVQLTYNGTAWSLPAGSKLKFSPQYNYFVYYPYQLEGLPGAPAKGTGATEENVASAKNFFAKAIDTWKSSKLAADQSTSVKMNACDLHIGKALLDDEDGCSVSFKMEHAMGLAEITLGAKTFDNNYYLSTYTSYTWKNGTTTFHAYAGISGYSLYKVADYRYVALVKPDVTTDFSCGSTTDADSWTGMVSVKPATNGVDKVTAISKRTSWSAKPYTMEVGDIYYNNGGITKPTTDEIAAARKNGLTTIGIIGYLGNDYWTESNTGSGYGGHALVMCLKTVGSEGRFSLGIGKQWYPQNIFVGNISDCYIDSHTKILASKNNLLGSGYYLTKDLQSFPNAYAAQAVNEYNKTILPKSTGWFLPSAGQVYALISSLGGVTQWESDEFWSFFIHNNSHEVTQRIDDFLSKVGESSYTDFFCNNNTCNWTSSQYSSSDALLIDSGIDDNGWYKSIRISPYGKDHVLPIRLFLAF